MAAGAVQELKARESSANAASDLQRALPVIIVASWNTTPQGSIQEMQATRDICGSKTFGQLLLTAGIHSGQPWSALQRDLGQESNQAWLYVFQTYANDNTAGPRENAERHLQGYRREFFGDEDLRKVMQEYLGDTALSLLNRLRCPAHRADVFRYVQHYQSGGLYLDIKCAFEQPFNDILSQVQSEWGQAEIARSKALGQTPGTAGLSPHSFFLTGIGRSKNHIFQGILWGPARHPLMWAALKHFFSPAIRSTTGKLDYLVFCKALWSVLKADLGQDPQWGWNVSNLYGPVYLLQEFHSKELQGTGRLQNDGHSFKTRGGQQVMLTRCWKWRNGWKTVEGSRVANEQQLLAFLPDAISDSTQTANATNAAKQEDPPPAKETHATKPEDPQPAGSSTAAKPDQPLHGDAHPGH